MKFRRAVPSILFSILFHALDIAARDLPYLNVTAITHANGESILQCWRLFTPFGVSYLPGVANGSYAFLGPVANATRTYKKWTVCYHT